MIEKAPKYEPEKATRFLFSALNILDLNEEIKKCEEEYFYWDKVKYLKTQFKDNDLLWHYIKIKRNSIERFNKISDLINYKYGINQFLQQKLHYLDFNFGTGIQKDVLL